MGYQLASGNPVIAVNSFSGFGQAPAPAKTTKGVPPFKFVCDGNSCGLPLGCAALEAGFRKRVLGAIELARNAAAKLKTPDQKTKDTFRDVFGQEITHSWDQPCCPREKMAAGKMAAMLFERVKKELQSRQTLYRCLSTVECAQATGRVREERPRQPTDLIVPDTNALAILCKDEVLLCPSFWQLKPEWQEGTILHEMFHLVFGLTCAWFQHDQTERPRNSAYCYEVFALRVAGKAIEQTSIKKCKAALSKNVP